MMQIERWMRGDIEDRVKIREYVHRSGIGRKLSDISDGGLRQIAFALEMKNRTVEEKRTIARKGFRAETRTTSSRETGTK